jgi:hypothetical protein
MIKHGRQMPKARKTQLLIKELPAETLIYDEESHQAHCLNQTAAWIWKRCDGKTKVREIAASVSRKARTPINEDVVWLALRELDRSHLLQGSVQRRAGVSRREVIRKSAMAALTLPLIASIATPAAAQVLSACPPGGIPCPAPPTCCFGAPCCAGVCCVIGAVCCGAVCCPPPQACCLGVCCGPGQTCNAGVCM